ncbi:acyl-CoA dehydrogenase family protein [Streptomyces regalis]|uniref:acyl-CoA dehydrogenase family protein n=1 Tax=Streptomyces regalis TaxID=68262 RepID=UPI000ABC2DE5|nr:acyl-CoA dehydrogenase family protein [Streptomyces regalis]
MTTVHASPVGSVADLDRTAFEALLARVCEGADRLDADEAGQARQVLTWLAEADATDLGAPGNAGGGLPGMAEVISALAARCVSSAFTTWAHRMCLEYLLMSGTPYALAQAERLRAGTVPGVTGMASAFRELAGCGSLEITATATGDGYELSGPIRWASNLYDDAVLVTAARTDTGDRIVVVLPLDSEGISVGRPFPLLALGSTASSYLNLKDVKVPHEQVLTRDFEGFLTSVRGTFLTLQTALCVGLAGTCLDNARASLTGVNTVFAGDVDRATGRLSVARTAMRDVARRVGSGNPATRMEMLSMRLAAAEVATEAATLEAKTAGGRGYARTSGASRRFRESFFIPVQSPSEAQLKWELAQCRP